MDHHPRRFEEAISILDLFFEAMDAGTLLSTPPLFDDFAALRRRVRQALFTLLVDGRPWLEAARGLAWPYAGLKRGAPFLEAAAAAGDSVRMRQEALLFLALLPFPGQWQRLLAWESHAERHPEIAALLAEEEKKISAKVAKKRQRRFKLRHFCQILKAPRLPHEKGVLRIFSLPYLFFGVPGLLKMLSRRHVIYMEPPWGVLARHAWLRVFSDLEDPCLIGAGGPEDRRFLKTQARILPIPLAHGDYLEEDGNIPLGAAKTFDIVFNGLFDDLPRKRHEALLDLLYRPELRHLNALFIGRGSAAAVAAFREKVALRGLEPRVTVIDNLPRHDVPEYLALCRMGLQISLHENVCRSIYEFFRSDVPCLVSTSMAGFNFDWITARNGAMAPDERLAHAILHMLGRLDQYAPRSWFLQESGSRNASRQLNGILKGLFSALGYEWQEDIVPLGSSGPNRYTDSAHYKRFLPEFATLFAIFQEFPLPVRIMPE